MAPPSAAATGTATRAHPPRDGAATRAAAGIATVACAADELYAGLTRAAANSPAVANRSAGSFWSAVNTAASTWGGTVLRWTTMGRGSSVSTRATIACDEEPVNGGSPASISYVMAPSAYTSARAVISRSPMACSGLM